MNNITNSTSSHLGTRAHPSFYRQKREREIIDISNRALQFIPTRVNASPASAAPRLSPIYIDPYTDPLPAHRIPNPTQPIPAIQKGVYTHRNGDRYEGALLNGLPWGKGVYTHRNGDRYEGDLLNGLPSGKGIYTYASGIRYKGDLLNGFPSGKGMYLYPNGGTYEGDILNGFPSGKGIYTYPNGVRYEGDLLNGLPSGTGKTFNSLASTYEGEFINGFRLGRGKMLHPNGTILSGIFHDTLFDPDITPLRKPIVIPHNKNPILLLTTTPNGDHNGACQAGLNSKFIQRVEETAHPIMQVSIGSSKELEEYTPDSTIELLWIFAHGDKHRMIFGEDSTDFSSLKPLLGKLDKDAIVILNSCDTGALTFPPQMPCIAQQILDYMASFGGNPTVIAPTTKNLSTITTFQKTEPGSNRFHFAQYSTQGEIVSRHFIRQIKK